MGSLKTRPTKWRMDQWNALATKCMYSLIHKPISNIHRRASVSLLPAHDDHEGAACPPFPGAPQRAVEEDAVPGVPLVRRLISFARLHGACSEREKNIPRKGSYTTMSV